MRSLDMAQHEAAHVVVGVALGLRLDRAALAPAPDLDPHEGGAAWFIVGRNHRQAWALTVAAGVAWERACTGVRWPHGSSADSRILRGLVRGRHAREALIRAAGAMLTTLAPVHARVTRALLERDLGPADVAALARGERPAA
jgi:hypothetical protein